MYDKTIANQILAFVINEQGSLFNLHDYFEIKDDVTNEPSCYCRFLRALEPPVSIYKSLEVEKMRMLVENHIHSRG
jgi:hypothetical protein